MARIGGNTIVEIQAFAKTGKNEFGESVCQWNTMHSLTGWLDLSSGNSAISSFNSKSQESTHIFICDYQPLMIKPEHSRLVDENGFIYDILLIDNPMRLNKHLEIYLKYTGGQ